MKLAVKKLPKLSYVLLSYNREKYIRKAIESAFAQDYEGELEYIFSDDCSTDRTFEIIKECVGQYKGSRRVIVTQTPYNMHLAGHTNHAVKFATGDFVVRADDDDISTIDRCSVIGNAIADNPGCSSVIARIRQFEDEEEDNVGKYSFQETNDTGYNILNISEGYDGVSEFFAPLRSNKAWSIKVYREFSSLPLDAYWVDDLICMYRANVLGRCVSVPSVVVWARVNNGNMCTGGGNGERGFSSIIRLETFNDKYLNVTYSPLEKSITEVEQYMINHSPELFHASVNFFDALKENMRRRAIERSYWRKGTINRFLIRRQLQKRGLFSLIRCLPMPIYAAMLAIWRKIKSFL